MVGRGRAQLYSEPAKIYNATLQHKYVNIFNSPAFRETFTPPLHSEMDYIENSEHFVFYCDSSTDCLIKV